DGVHFVGEADIGHDNAAEGHKGRVDLHHGCANPKGPVAVADTGAKLLQESAYAGVVVLGSLPAESSDESAKLPAAVDQWADLQRHLLKLVSEPDALVAERLQGLRNSVHAAPLLPGDTDERHRAGVAHDYSS